MGEYLSSHKITRQQEIRLRAERIISSLNLELIKLSPRRMDSFLEEMGLNKKNRTEVVNKWE